ncbi:MAG TPA: ferrous iron transport protein B [Clostridium sp.]|uniref:ferrous iron transport protein B n=1 Tax=Clostridium sp. TaxID=1506 RepID=UPI002F933FF0
MSKDLVIALAGNPNCGKTSMFNELTGAKQHVGNWPGVTVEKKEGNLKFENRNLTVVDLPGTYSLGAYSEDEVVACNFILKDKPDVVINVIDSTNLERNLYLTMQLLETGAKVILALNMADEAKKKNIQINIKELSKQLNLTIIPTVAPKGEGIKELMREAIKLSDQSKNSVYKVDYGKDIEKEIKLIKEAISECAATSEYPTEWAALRLLENDEYVKKYISKIENDEKVSSKVEKSIENLTSIIGYEPDTFIIDKRYEAISNATKNCVTKEEITGETTSDKIDKIVTNKWLGMPIFVLIMFFMYQISISFGNGFLGGILGDGMDSLGKFLGSTLANVGAPELLISFVTDGLIGGVGSVLVFMPMILTMYFLMSILEDSGYMSRAAYVMDKLMSSLGLHGKTAIALILSSGCAVSGIMSTRTLESKKDRMVAILISPFMSCPARLVVYGVFVAAFFADKKVWIFNEGGLIIFLLYVLGIVVAILMGKFYSKKVFKGENSYFIMELPPYRLPTAKSIFVHMWEKSQHFLKRAGTIILGVVVIVWALSNLPYGVEAGSQHSILGIIGTFIAPIFAPAGFGNWQSGVALITGFAAKEAVIGTLGTIYGVSNGPHLIGAIQHAFTPLTALSFMVMTLLYVPCVATIGTIKKETNSTKWAVVSAVVSCLIGWVGAVMVYQIGTLLGFS